MGVRYIAQRATTGEFLHWELPLTVESVSWELSGPGALRATLKPEQIADPIAPDGRRILEPWGTYLYVERDGVIQWGGIVYHSAYDGPEWTVEAAGFSTYAQGIPFDDEYSAVEVDPAFVFSYLWSWMMAHPPAPVVTVEGISTAVRMGTAEEPYALYWYEARDIGQELDDLALQGGFEYVERHAWTANGQITHTIQLSPLFGRVRDDLAFIQGDNIRSVVPVEESTDYANEVFALGAGEGRDTIATTAAIRDGRLRRPYVYTDKGEPSRDRLLSIANLELAVRQTTPLTVASIDVIDHPNAPLGSWQVGDTVLVDAALPWVGRVHVWRRITAWEQTGDYTATITFGTTPATTGGSA